MRTVDREKDTIICDLDGTVALDETRAIQYLRKPHAETCEIGMYETQNAGTCTCGWKRDWAGYFAACSGDDPNEAVIQILRYFWDDGYTIRLLTGRDEGVRVLTEQWLRAHAVPYHSLVMRATNDRTDDHEMKPAVAFVEGWLPKNTLLVLEDRQRVVDAWRSKGYTVFQVAPGNF